MGIVQRRKRRNRLRPIQTTAEVDAYGASDTKHIRRLRDRVFSMIEVARTDRATRWARLWEHVTGVELTKSAMRTSYKRVRIAGDPTGWHDINSTAASCLADRGSELPALLDRIDKGEAASVPCDRIMDMSVGLTGKSLAQFRGSIVDTAGGEPWRVWKPGSPGGLSSHVHVGVLRHITGGEHDLRTLAGTDWVVVRREATDPLTVRTELAQIAAMDVAIDHFTSVVNLPNTDPEALTQHLGAVAGMINKYGVIGTYTRAATLIMQHREAAKAAAVDAPVAPLIDLSADGVTV